MEKDYYQTLFLTEEASEDSVKAAYLALQQLPEFQPQLAQLSEAFAVLSDKDLRAKYDQRRKAPPLGKKEGNYLYLKKLGEGGFGTTYLAEHTLVGRRVCVKHCKNIRNGEEALVAEAQSIWDLSHQNVTFMRDMIRCSDGTLALVMKFVPGPTLQKVITSTYEQTRGGLNPQELAWIVERVLYALKFLSIHDGVVHGDLKPGNIIVQWEVHEAILIDFGLAMVKPGRTSQSRGYTEFFSPPEAIEGKTQVPESDLFSLGMTMLYALNGNYEDAAKFRFPPNTPRPMAEFILRLAQRDVLKRPRWENEDLIETFVKVRMASFGRRWSEIRPLIF